MMATRNLCTLLLCGVAILVQLSVAPVAGAEFTTQVIVRDVASVTTREVTLGQIAEVSALRASNFEEAKKLEEVIVCSNLNVGETVKLKAEDILKAIHGLGMSQGAVGYRIPQEVTIRRPGVPLSRERLREVLSEALHRTVPSAEISDVNSLRIPALFDADSLVAAEYLGPTGAAGGRFLLRVEGKEGESLSQEVTAGVRELSEVVVAAREIERGTAISDEDLAYIRVDSRKARAALATKAEDLIGMQTTRHISQGTPLTEQVVKAPPLVRKSQKVTVRYRSGFLEATAVGIALSDAPLGALVRVRNEASQKIIEGRVAAEDLVEVTP